MTADKRQLVWDWPVRLVHWSMAILVLLLWWTAEEGIMDWHKRLGLTMLGLLVFRLVWGIAGSWTARFAPMIKGLAKLPAYFAALLKGGHKPSFGHNPMGVLSVFALLTLLGLQVGSGLFAVDVDGLESGPLSTFVSFGTGRDFADYHEFNFDILAVFIGLHILAILSYQFLIKDRLIGPMITGKRPAQDFGETPLPTMAVRPAALFAALLIAIGGVYLVANAG